MSPNIIELAFEEIYDQLKSNFENSLAEGIFPDDLKAAHETIIDQYLSYHASRKFSKRLMLFVRLFTYLTEK